MGAALSSHHSGAYTVRQNADINVTPFVDVMLVLLIIFMVALPVSTVSVKVDLPESNAQPIKAQPPVVVSEGLASYFSLFWDWSYGSRELKRLLASGFIPLERLVREPIGAYVNGAQDRFMELGMFFHYLLNYREDTKTVANEQGEVGPMRDMLRAMFRGQVATALPAYRTLNQDLAKVEADFKAFDFQIP